MDAHLRCDAWDPSSKNCSNERLIAGCGADDGSQLGRIQAKREGSCCNVVGQLARELACEDGIRDRDTDLKKQAFSGCIVSGKK